MIVKSVVSQKSQSPYPARSFSADSPSAASATAATRARSSCDSNAFVTAQPGARDAPARTLAALPPIADALPIISTRTSGHRLMSSFSSVFFLKIPRYSRQSSLSLFSSRQVRSNSDAVFGALLGTFFAFRDRAAASLLNFISGVLDLRRRRRLRRGR